MTVMEIDRKTTRRRNVISRYRKQVKAQERLLIRAHLALGGLAATLSDLTTIIDVKALSDDIRQTNDRTRELMRDIDEQFR